MTGHLIATALPPLDSSTLLYYAVLVYGAARGAAKGYEWLSDFLEKRRKGYAEEIGRATEGARLSREEAVELTAIQEKTITRLKDELTEAEHREAEAVRQVVDWKAKAGELDAKLATAGRQWFEREGFISELERRLAKLERERNP